MKIHLNDIVLDSKLQRMDRVEGISKQNDEFLIKSLKNEGLTDHLVVQKIPGDNKWRLVKGYRRLHMLIALNKENKLPPDISLTSLPVVEVKEDINPALLRVESHRWEDFLPSEKAERIVELKDKFDMSLKEIADMYGWSMPSVRNWLIINKVLPEIKEYIDNGKYPMSAGKVFGTMNPKGQMVLHSKFRNQTTAVKRADLWYEWRKLKDKDTLFVTPKKKRFKIAERLIATKPGSKHKHRIFVSKERREKEILSQNISLLQKHNIIMQRDRNLYESKLMDILRTVEIWFREEEIRNYVEEMHQEIYEGLKVYIELLLNIKIAE